MSYVAWHNEVGAIRWGRLIAVDVDSKTAFTDRHIAIPCDDLVAQAPSLAKLEEQVGLHREACQTCKLARAALLAMIRKVCV